MRGTTVGGGGHCYLLYISAEHHIINTVKVLDRKTVYSVPSEGKM
jgi:hypothetical protein